MGSGKADAETSEWNCGLSWILLIMGIIQTGIGAHYVRDCTLAYFIAIFLIVSGCTSMIIGVLWLPGSKEKETGCYTVSLGILVLFGLVWLITGSGVLFSNWQKYSNPQCNPDDEDCKTCNRVLFISAAGIIFLELACAVLVFCYLCYIGIRSIWTCCSSYVRF